MIRDLLPTLRIDKDGRLFIDDPTRPTLYDQDALPPTREEIIASGGICAPLQPSVLYPVNRTNPYDQDAIR